MLRARVWKALDVEEDDRGFERALNIALGCLIVISTADVILGTVEDLQAAYGQSFAVIEAISLAVFSVEYALRLWSCVADPRYVGTLSGRLRFAASPLALIDLVAILPSLIPGGSLDLRFMRIFRLIRLMRIFKLVRYSESLQLLLRVLVSRRQQLAATAAAGGALLLVASCAIFFAEHDAQPKAFSSIPASMWWGVVTLTTVGYGDIFPVTVPGKILAGMIAALGVGLFALPAGIVAGGFTEILQERHKKNCPHCGKDLD